MSRETLLEGTLESDGLYSFKTLPHLQGPSNVNSKSYASSVTTNIPNSCCFTSTFVNNASTWHYRLGHANDAAIKSVLQLCNISSSNKIGPDFCDSCCLGKAHRLYAPPSLTSHNTPFELVHSDLWEPSPSPSHGSYSYYIAFVDACTKYTWIYFLKHKSDALNAFKQFHSLVQNQFFITIKSVQTDWGSEYRPFTKYLADLGLSHRLTCPHTSQQNGIVERKHRQIVEMGLTLLAHASIPIHFWDHSFTTAVHLINKLPTSALPNFISPHYVLFNSIHDYNSLRIFGCACFPLLHPFNQHKLQFRSAECIHLGMSPNHKGHKCLSPDGKIYISKDVLFNEFRFPFTTVFPNKLSSTSASPSTFPAAIPLLSFPAQVPPSPPPSNEAVHDPMTSTASSSTVSDSSSPHLFLQLMIMLHLNLIF